MKILPVSDVDLYYALEVKQALCSEGFRVDVDARYEKLGYKIREAQLSKVPYMVVLGESERTNGTISVRKRGEGDVGSKQLQSFIDQIRIEIELKSAH
ncbi:His/Gly/Thr/Pro-type tRNA ligase C-terminal domain-containing protein [Paenibacillus sp. GSMTC-2017]|uniref:His/Gly/Thr/Pro-type tRNA ligase C-terminal domain-containing protein n=1 Tax=Paenibacillus sp. GSMTC-2017 TaxID=2794350 RepID=UPI003FA7363F